MDAVKVIKAIDEALPDEVILQDIHNLLAQDAVDGQTRIELGREWASIPINTPVDIVTKAFYKEYYNAGWGTSYRVLTAIGGFREDRHGLHTAGYCFATLYYNEQGHRITEDFHVEFR